MIGMSEQVGSKRIVIPYETRLEVVAYSVDIYLCKVFIHYETIKTEYQCIDAGCLGCGNPIAFL